MGSDKTEIQTISFTNIIKGGIDLYTIDKLPSGNLLVLLNEFASPSEIMPSVAKELKGTSNANVILDGLLYYGNTNQRYMYLTWDGEELTYHTFLDYSLVDIEVIESSAYFYMEHYGECIEYSLLTDEEKALVKAGEPLG